MAYGKVWEDAHRALEWNTRLILRVSDGSGNPTIPSKKINAAVAVQRIQLRSLKADMQMFKVQAQHQLDIGNARDAIAAAQQARDILKKSSVMVLKMGMISMGCPPEIAEGVSKGFSVFLNTADEVIGNNWILKGKVLSEKEMQTIFLLNILKAGVDEASDALVGKFRGADNEYVKQVFKTIGPDHVGDVIKKTIDLAFINAPGGPTLAPKPAAIKAAFSQVAAAKLAELESIGKAGWDNQDFFNWLSGTMIDTLGTVATKKAGG